MKKRLLGILFLTGMVIASAGISAKELTLKPIETEALHIPTNIYTLTLGPANGSEALRVAFLSEEIYSSLYIERLRFGEMEGETTRIQAHYYFDSFSIAKLLGLKEGFISNLKLVKWHTWQAFEVQAEEGRFILTYRPKKDRFVIRKVKK